MILKKRPPVRPSPFAPVKRLPPDARKLRHFAVDNGRAFAVLDDGSVWMATPSNPNWNPGPFPRCPWFEPQTGVKP